MTTRRMLLIGATGLLPLRRAYADTSQQLQPGDYGYLHDKYHSSYQQVFSPHCSCGVGDCRVTDWRETKMNSPYGYDVIAERNWYPLLKGVYIPAPNLVPEALRKERAHICAYLIGDMYIACAIINSIDT